MASVSPPATPASPPRPQLEDYTFVCHGCNIMLRGFTQELEKIEYVGPGHCSGCEFRTEDGYLVRGLRTLNKEGLAEYRQWMKKEMFWDFSQRAAASRRRQREIDYLR
ncbi:uncharacterized protein N7506_012204 [Penicillium brevicompactum]|uniref:uncharacterized protein n=1 Tax=Penicillium brevicompactum TaxID=5074 RepID=UPI002541E0FC|nr:uncharacterized protein N7506_012204 [Penicillium brevicompactum]KAJ5319500.1 hypothetical protein N7506_012204 [Penicillium brevicompactum]